jgi:hypothetical protein
MAMRMGCDFTVANVADTLAFLLFVYGRFWAAVG